MRENAQPHASPVFMPKNRIDTLFSLLRLKKQAAFIPFIMAGDYSLEASQALLNALPSFGADIIELGIPFTDPMADGVAIQQAGRRALQAGMTVKKALEMVTKFRHEHPSTPLVMMGYYNPILSYGLESFTKDAAAAGVDGLIIVDLPPEEAGSLEKELKHTALHSIRLLAPTTPLDRQKYIAAHAGGFLYYVSVLGVTGTKTADADFLAKQIPALRTITDLPLGIGFGIKTAEQAAMMAKIGDAVIVGSAIAEKISTLQNAPLTEFVAEVGKFVTTLSTATKMQSIS